MCLPPTPPDRVPGALSVAMAPYDTDGTDDRNPVGEWDWWAVHVPPASPYLVRPAYDGDPRLLTPANVPHYRSGEDPLGPLECFGGPRGLLDFDAMRQQAVQAYDALSAAWEDLVAAHPPAAGDPHFGTGFLATGPVAYVDRDHAAARGRALRTAVPGHALLTLDGRRRDGYGDGYAEGADDCLEHLDPEAVVGGVICNC